MQKKSIYINIVLYVFSLLIIGSFQAIATMQEPDMIFYGNQLLPLEGAPLNRYCWPDNKCPTFRVNCSCNWRGYIAYWMIKDNKLYLKDIDEAMIDISNNKYENLQEFLDKGEFISASVEDLFTNVDKNGLVFAVWYSGTFRIGDGKIVWNDPVGGFGRYYSREIHLKVDHGIVVSEYIKHNTAESVEKGWRNKIDNYRKKNQ